MKRTNRIEAIIVATVACATFVSSTPTRGIALTEVTTPSVVSFDEIDHVYTNGQIPPPGSFAADAAAVMPVAPAAPAAPKRSRFFDTLSSASGMLSGAASVVSASGEIGRLLRVADSVGKVVPIANGMGLAGSRRFDTLLQTYLLPRVSPTGTVLLSDFLSAQNEFKSRFPNAHANVAEQPAPERLVSYARGTLRHYIIGANGWVRIDEPGGTTTLIVKPDLGKTYLIDSARRSVRIGIFGRPDAVPASIVAVPDGTAAVVERVESIGEADVDGIVSAGFKTHASVRVQGGDARCAGATLTSTRVEYFAPLRIASEAANVSPAVRAMTDGGCEPTGHVAHDGANVPINRLLMYQANTVEQSGTHGSDRYTLVIERGNVNEMSSAAASAFDIPSEYQQVASVATTRQRP